MEKKEKKESESTGVGWTGLRGIYLVIHLRGNDGFLGYNFEQERRLLYYRQCRGGGILLVGLI